jgi:NAD(P)-dependent dehydrogenase (short-subunit alcohol dehydrogenase family)
MSRKLRDSVVVITGASTGIGRATALAFARQGAHVALASRREDALERTAQECRSFGARALVVPTDVTDEAAVEQAAQNAFQEFGRLDVWVNNAAVTAFGRFEETPPEVYRKVIETNLFGYVHGARAALPYFREQGSGTLINVSSVVGVAGIPYVNSYVTSKFAIRGFSESLREEMADEPINVCTILPSSIDTPLFQQGANFMGWGSKPLPPGHSGLRPEPQARGNCGQRRAHAKRLSWGGPQSLRADDGQADSQGALQRAEGTPHPR